MKILSYNLWHGLSPKGLLEFEELEPKDRRLKREQLQIDLLKNTDADLFLFQEVNPLSERGPDFERILRKRGEWLADNSGLKFAGFGFPKNLQTGLATFYSDQFILRNKIASRLSGPPVGQYFSLQLKESRYALALDLNHPKWGRVLVVNLHLHHGLEFTEGLRQKFRDLVSDKMLTEGAKVDLFYRLGEGERRRRLELECLLKQVKERQNQYAMILIGGDFNFSPEDPCYQLMKDQGFTDLNHAGGPTYDLVDNSSHRSFLKDFPMPLLFEDLTFDEKVRSRILEILKEHDERPRRIDYLWAMPSSGDLKIQSVARVGDKIEDEMTPSDHYGAQVEIEWNH